MSNTVALELTVLSATLAKNVQFMSAGLMDPFCLVELKDGNGNVLLSERSPTDWNSHKNPVWNFQLSKLIRAPIDSSSMVHFQVCNDSSSPLPGNPNKVTIGDLYYPLQELIHKSNNIASTFKHDLTQPPEASFAAHHSPKAIARNVIKHATQPFAKKTKERTDDASQASRPLFAGTLLIQTRLTEASVQTPRGLIQNKTNVLPSYFDLTKTTRMGVSGGTAPFFHLHLSEAGKKWHKDIHQSPPGGVGVSETYYLGKDLSRAEDELEFYEKLLRFQNQAKDVDGGFLKLLPFTFDYAGILKAPKPQVEESNQNSDATSETLELLVLRNLRDGVKKLRLLDLKLGQKTAQANWRGKSRFRAYRQKILVDNNTNSTNEGYRLEGFDGLPVSLESMDPLMDWIAYQQELEQTEDNKESTKCKHRISVPKASIKQKKKAQRIMFQHLNGTEIMMHFINVIGEGNTSINDIEYLTPIEVIEIVLHETVTRLVKLARVLHLAIAWPQKWIGSSVALGYDVGDINPPRNVDAQHAIRDKVICSVFDWGRSELLTSLEAFEALTVDEKLDRSKFWSYYKGGINHLSFIAAKTYCNTFGCAEGWSHLNITLMDFDSVSKDDFLGQVTLKLPTKPYTEDDGEAPGDDVIIADGKVRTYTLMGNNKASSISQLIQIGSVVKSLIQPDFGTIDLAVSWWQSPESSRLKGSWRIRIVKASNLKIMDTISQSSDPYCIVTAYNKASNKSSVPRLEFKQVTSIKALTLEPNWGEDGEILDIPVPKTPNYLGEALKAGGLNSMKHDLLYSMLAQEQRASSSARNTIESITQTLSLSSSNTLQDEASGSEPPLETWTRALILSD